MFNFIMRIFLRIVRPSHIELRELPTRERQGVQIIQMISYCPSFKWPLTHNTGRYYYKKIDSVQSTIL